MGHTPRDKRPAGQLLSSDPLKPLLPIHPETVLDVAKNGIYDSYFSVKEVDAYILHHYALLVGMPYPEDILYLPPWSERWGLSSRLVFRAPHNPALIPMEDGETVGSTDDETGLFTSYSNGFNFGLLKALKPYGVKFNYARIPYFHNLTLEEVMSGTIS